MSKHTKEPNVGSGDRRKSPWDLPWTSYPGRADQGIRLHYKKSVATFERVKTYIGKRHCQRSCATHKKPSKNWSERLERKRILHYNWSRNNFRPDDVSTSRDWDLMSQFPPVHNSDPGPERLAFPECRTRPTEHISCCLGYTLFMEGAL
jgi:hypothetical protein